MKTLGKLGTHRYYTVLLHTITILVRTVRFLTIVIDLVQTIAPRNYILGNFKPTIQELKSQ